MHYPTIDAIIPVYNGEYFIADAIHSALSQDTAPRKVIVIDDGSTDGTPEVLDRFRSQIHIVRHKKNRGLPAARNTGIAESDADLLAFLDADDVWTTDKLSKQLDSFRSNDRIGLCYTGVIDCDMALSQVQKAKTPRARCGEDIFRELYLDAFPMPPSTVVVRHEVFSTCGMFDESMLKAQDFECWLRITMRYPISCIPEPLCKRRLNPSSITSTAGVQRDMYYAPRAFDLCAAAAERWGIALPMPVEDRKLLFFKRRCHEAFKAGRIDAATEYRRAWEQLARIPTKDRLALSAARGVARARLRLKHWIGKRTTLLI